MLVLVPLFILWQGNVQVFLVAAAQWLSGAGFFCAGFRQVQSPDVEPRGGSPFLPDPALIISADQAHVAAESVSRCISLFLFFVPALIKILDGFGPQFLAANRGSLSDRVKFFLFWSDRGGLR